jgi:hypothetical protein
VEERRKEYPPWKRKLPSLWRGSYQVESGRHISEATIKKYREEQKNKECLSSHLYRGWAFPALSRKVLQSAFFLMVTIG